MIKTAIILALIILEGLTVPPLDPLKVLDRWELSPAGLVMVQYGPPSYPVWGVYTIKWHGTCKNVLTISKESVILKLEGIDYCYLVVKEPIGYILNKDLPNSEFIGLIEKTWPLIK